MIAAATVRISRTEGADSDSRSCSTDSSTGSSSPRRNELRTASMRTPRVRRARDVEQQVVEQLDRRRAGVGLLALVVEALQLAVGVAEQALDGDARLEPVGAQRVEQRAGDPPELVHRRRRRDRFHAVRDLGQRVQAAVAALAADEPEQAGLEAGAGGAPIAITVSFASGAPAASAAGAFSELRLSESSVPSDRSGAPRTARRSLSSGSSTSARSRPPPSTRSR